MIKSENLLRFLLFILCRSQTICVLQVLYDDEMIISVIEKQSCRIQYLQVSVKSQKEHTKTMKDILSSVKRCKIAIL